MSKKKATFYEELADTFNKFSDICHNVTVGKMDTLQKAEEAKNEGKVSKILVADQDFNFVCVMNEKLIDHLISKQFKLSKIYEVESEEPAKKKIFDINFAKNEEFILDNIVGDRINRNENFNLKDCCILLYFVN